MVLIYARASTEPGNVVSHLSLHDLIQQAHKVIGISRPLAQERSSGEIPQQFCSPGCRVPRRPGQQLLARRKRRRFHQRDDKIDHGCGDQVSHGQDRRRWIQVIGLLSHIQIPGYLRIVSTQQPGNCSCCPWNCPALHRSQGPCWRRHPFRLHPERAAQWWCPRHLSGPRQGLLRRWRLGLLRYPDHHPRSLHLRRRCSQCRVLRCLHAWQRLEVFCKGITTLWDGYMAVG